MRGDTDNRVHLRIKVMRTAEGLNRNVVLLDLCGRPLEVLFANKGQKPNEVVGSTEHSRVQNGVQFSALRLKLADGLMQEVFPRKNSPLVSQSTFFRDSIPQIPGKGCFAENLNPDEVRAEFPISTGVPGGTQNANRCLELGMTSPWAPRCPEPGASRKITVNSR